MVVELMLVCRIVVLLTEALCDDFLCLMALNKQHVHHKEPQVYSNIRGRAEKFLALDKRIQEDQTIMILFNIFFSQIHTLITMFLQFFKALKKELARLGLQPGREQRSLSNRSEILFP